MITLLRNAHLVLHRGSLADQFGYRNTVQELMMMSSVFRSLPHRRGSTLCGLVAPSWPPCPPSSRCGSASRSTTRQAPLSSTGSASECHTPYSLPLPPPPYNSLLHQTLNLRLSQSPPHPRQPLNMNLPLCLP